jgi:predicted nucleic acid-binding protein
MTVFVDTSALFAILDADDHNHSAALGAWTRLLSEQTTLLTHNYILVEAGALAQRRLGPAALRALFEDIQPIFRVEWITESHHRRAVDMALAAARKKLSLVDCVSFVVVRETAADRVFCFDRHFREYGFQTIP